MGWKGRKASHRKKVTKRLKERSKYVLYTTTTSGNSWEFPCYYWDTHSLYAKSYYTRKGCKLHCCSIYSILVKGKHPKKYIDV